MARLIKNSTKQIIVSDTTTLISLEKQHKLDLLCELFHKIYLPQTVYQELLAGIRNQQAIQRLQNNPCFRVEAVTPSAQLKALLLVLDQGEAEAIEMANIKQLPLIIDEKKGRAVASRLNLQIIGLPGLLIMASKLKILSVDEAKEILEQAINKGHRLSKKLYQQVLAELMS